MLPKINRLTTREFQAVFSKNIATRSQNMSLLTPLGNEFDKKYAVAVSKKVYSRRVDRNRLRRLIYQAIRRLLIENQPEIKSGIILINRGSDLLALPHPHLTSELEQLLVPKNH